MANGELRRQVAARRMYFDLVADHELLGGNKVKVGYVLNLFGAHHPDDHPRPGGVGSLEIFHELERVGSAVVLPDDPAFSVHPEPFNGLLLDAPAQHTDEVSAALTLRLRPGVSARAEEASLRALGGRLRSLGLHEGAWRPAGDSAP